MHIESLKHLVTDSMLQCPNLCKLDNIFENRYSFTRGIVGRSLMAFGVSWACEFEELLQRLFPGEDNLLLAAKGYATFAMKSMRLQAEFERNGQYRARSFDEAAEAVYFNEDHMMKEYLPGLQLSHYLWPHHYRQLRYFDLAFADAMRVAGANQFVEVGIGTGLYSQRLLRSVPTVEGVGFDISAWSKSFAEQQMQAFNLNTRYQVKLQDVSTKILDSSVDWLICVEVLEHLEDPLAFLRVLRTALRPGGTAFITAALNAAHEDHIYLYRSAADVAGQITECGFTIEQYFCAQAYPQSRVGIPVPEAAAFVVH